MLVRFDPVIFAVSIGLFIYSIYYLFVKKWKPRTLVKGAFYFTLFASLVWMILEIFILVIWGNG